MGGGDIQTRAPAAAEWNDWRQRFGGSAACCAGPLLIDLVGQLGYTYKRARIGSVRHEPNEAYQRLGGWLRAVASPDPLNRIL